jgi:serine/threonine-protein phosphatase 2A activator
MVALLENINLWVDQVPPIQQPQRYGNKAFGTLQRKIEAEGKELIRTLLRTKPQGQELIERRADEELSVYLSYSFGDPIRIDYGTGHELNFLALLMCLVILGYFEQSDLKVLVHQVFWKYVKVMRKIQTVYKLEPAGSHGVWGLDDYHFLPFIFGASELNGHQRYGPAAIHDDSVLERESEEFLYFHCILYIKQVKSSGHFGEHSPMLNDISAVPSWEKVAGGLVKMYRTEVMNKFPVMKHFFFGSILKFQPNN